MKMGNFKQLLAKQSPESQKRIAEKMEQLRVEISLSKLRDELEMSQKQVAEAMGVSQPTVAKIENAENDPRLSTLKRYVAAMGGELSLDITLPNGKRVAFHV
jgi:DNA-binding XRE family transcriptional regulator